jgi:hypothetical protein
MSSDELKKLEERRKWDWVFWAMMLICFILGGIFALLEISGFFKEIGLIGSIFLPMVGLAFGLIGSARILHSIDVKTSKVCDAVMKEGEETRNVLGSKMDSLGEKMDGMKVVMEEIRDLMRGG